MEKVFLASPSWGRVSAQTAMSAARDIYLGIIREWKICHSPLIAANRNELLQHFVMSGDPHMIMVDDDVEWGPSVIPHMVAMMTTGDPIVFIDMPDRKWDTNAYTWDGDGGDLGPAPFSTLPFHAEAFGCGMIGMTRELARDLHQPFDHVEHNGFQRREDLSFSMLLAENKIHALCLPGMDVIHHMTQPTRPRGTLYKDPPSGYNSQYSG